MSAGFVRVERSNKENKDLQLEPPRQTQKIHSLALSNEKRLLTKCWKGNPISPFQQTFPFPNFLILRTDEQETSPR